MPYNHLFREGFVRSRYFELLKTPILLNWTLTSLQKQTTNTNTLLNKLSQIYILSSFRAPLGCLWIPLGWPAESLTANRKSFLTCCHFVHHRTLSERPRAIFGEGFGHRGGVRTFPKVIRQETSDRINWFTSTLKKPPTMSGSTKLAGGRIGKPISNKANIYC